MIDLTTYALLRKQITTAASGISDVRAEGDELVFVLADGNEVRVAIPATEIRDAVVRDDVLVLTLEDDKEVVVDATLTQSGQAADAKVTGDALALKLTEPSTGLAVGKYFRIAAIDEAGHAVLEAVDLPSAPVQDVQVNGASIVADGVANIKANRYGIGFNNVGLYLSSATFNQISARQNSNVPITPTNYDYAVRAAMCDGKGAAWTEAEQAAARERMGLPGDYELIEEIICDGTASGYTRNVDPSGNPYDFESVYIEIEIQAENTYTSVFFRAYDELNQCVLYDGASVPSKTYTSYLCSGCYADKGLYRGWLISQNIASANDGGSQPVRNNRPTPVVSTIKKVFVNINSGTFFAGDKIRIYGVRA